MVFQWMTALVTRCRRRPMSRLAVTVPSLSEAAQRTSSSQPSRIRPRSAGAEQPSGRRVERRAEAVRLDRLAFEGVQAHDAVVAVEQPLVQGVQAVALGGGRSEGRFRSRIGPCNWSVQPASEMVAMLCALD